MDLTSRTAVGEALLLDETLPSRVTDALFERHPDWKARFGEHGQRRCTEDARSHISFLAGAIQAGRAEPFVEYATWCGAMLVARGIEREHLREHFGLLEEQIDPARCGAEGADLVGQTLRAACVELLRAIPVPVDLPDARTPVRLAYLSAALAGKRGEAWEATREGARRGLTVVELYRDVVLWTQRRLGELWVETKISVAQEHMASSVTQSVIARLYAEIPGDRACGRALLAGVEGELHVLPAQLASDLLELDGWDVAFVGTHVPLQSVVAAIEAEKPDVLGISTTMVFNLPKLVSLVTAVRGRFATLPIVLGGSAVRGAVDLATELDVALDAGGAAFRSLARSH